MVEKSHAHCADVKDTKCCSRACGMVAGGVLWTRRVKGTVRAAVCPNSVTLDVARHGHLSLLLLYNKCIITRVTRHL